MNNLQLFYPTAHRPPVTTHPFGEKRSYALGFHEGIDLRSFVGEEVYAPIDGVVTIASFGKMYGNQVWLQCQLEADKIQTVCAHLNQIDPNIKVGKLVKRGERIGWSGNTGNSQGAHLHLSLLINGKWTDPASYLVYPE